MKKVILFAALFISIIGSFSFSARELGNSKNETLDASGKYVYFRAYSFTDKTYYFSNIIWLEDDYKTDKLWEHKKSFKKLMKSEHGTDYSGTVQEYTDSDENLLVSDRKTRIKQAGDNVKYIDL